MEADEHVHEGQAAGLLSVVSKPVDRVFVESGVDPKAHVNDSDGEVTLQHSIHICGIDSSQLPIERGDPLRVAQRLEVVLLEIVGWKGKLGLLEGVHDLGVPNADSAIWAQV